MGVRDVFERMASRFLWPPENFVRSQGPRLELFPGKSLVYNSCFTRERTAVVLAVLYCMYIPRKSAKYHSKMYFLGLGGLSACLAKLFCRICVPRPTDIIYGEKVYVLYDLMC